MQVERTGVDKSGIKLGLKPVFFQATYMNWSVLYHFETRMEIKAEILVIKNITKECISLQKRQYTRNRRTLVKDELLNYGLQICHVFYIGKLIKNYVYEKCLGVFPWDTSSWSNNIKNEMWVFIPDKQRSGWGPVWVLPIVFFPSTKNGEFFDQVRRNYVDSGSLP
jgi:hypothetical protein